MRLFTLLELCTYLLLIPIVYKVVTVIDLTKLFKKHHTTEIRLFYLFIIIIITKILGDFIIMIMADIRFLLDITL